MRIGYPYRTIRPALGAIVPAAIALAPLVAAAQTPTFAPARLVSGEPPSPPIRVVAGGQAWLRVTVDETGSVERITALKAAPGFNEPLRRAVGTWSFQPARVDGEPAGSDLLVVGIFRPPALYAPVALETPTGVPDLDLPIPTETPIPPYPPRAQGDGVVLLEVSVNARGAVDDVTIVVTTPGFGPAASRAVEQWTFRAAIRDGQPGPGIVYVTCSFPEPVVAH